MAITWELLTPASHPPALGGTDHGMARDVDEKLTTYIQTGLLTAETWRWNLDNWILETPAATISRPRVAFGIAYHESSGKTVLFGGRRFAVTGIAPDTEGFLSDTWLWDGSTWIDAAPLTTPDFGREGPKMASHPPSDKVILFGGFDPFAGFSDQTWSWDGTGDWFQETPSNVPPGLGGHAMCYHPPTEKVVMFGGANFSGYNTVTRTWDGSDWTDETPVTSPSSRTNISMAYDNASKKVILFGGATPGGTFNAQTYAWDGTNWELLTPTTSPSARFFYLLGQDPSTGRPLLFGGETAAGVFSTQTWRFLAPITRTNPSTVAGKLGYYHNGAWHIVRDLI